MRISMSTLFIVLFLRSGNSKPGIKKAFTYLSKYGYLDQYKEGSLPIISAKSAKESIKQFQRFVGIPATGKLDRHTIKMMSMPRCGVKDTTGLSKHRVKRFDLEGSAWPKKLLTYRINKYPEKLKKNDVDFTIRKAFDLWSSQSNLMFEPTFNASKMVDIDIAFLKGKHGDDSPFEGPGGVLAHAFFPKFGGDVHFDDSEIWTINSVDGTNLLQVANHEIGHSLGLSHSDELEASMSPLYNEYIPNFMLHMDDIDGIQKLYGRKMKKTPKEMPKIPEEESGEITEEIWDDYFEQLLSELG